MIRSRPALARILLALVVALAGAGTIVAAAGAVREPPALTSSGAWTTLASSQVPRTEPGAAVVGNSIYVVGGMLWDGATTNLVERYDIRSGRWEWAPPLPIAVNHPAVASFGGKVYAFGGYTSNAGFFGLTGETDALQRLDPRTGKWTVLPPSGFARAAATLVPAAGRLYAIGGAHESATPLSLVQSYDPVKARWRSEPPFRIAREHLAGTAAGGKIYVLAGRVKDHPLTAVERYDPAKRKWVTLPSLHTPRSGFGAVTVAGRVIAVGGENLESGSTIAPVEAYDTAKKRWLPLPPLPTPRHGLGVVSSGSRVFVATGGPQARLSVSATLEAIRLTRSQLGLGPKRGGPKKP